MQKKHRTPTSLDCNAAVNGNQGCGNSFTTPNSYGPGFNSAGGGWYVLKRTTADGAYVYFWSRNDPSVPAAVKSGEKSISPDDSWGTPAARFPTDSCNWAQHFNSHSIVFDLTFCVSVIISMLYSLWWLWSNAEVFDLIRVIGQEAPSEVPRAAVVAVLIVSDCNR